MDTRPAGRIARSGGERGTAQPAPTLCIVTGGGVTNPSSRQRALQFIPLLQRHGFDVRCALVDAGRTMVNVRRVAEALRGADIVFVQRVLAWWLLPLLRRSGARIVYDFDDAIHLIRQGQVAAAMAPRSWRDRAIVAYRLLVRGDRLASSRARLLRRMIRSADAVIAGNSNLAVWVADKHAEVIATSVPVHQLPMRVHEPVHVVRIGWIGVASNLMHLSLVSDALAEVARRYGGRVRLTVVSNRQPESLPIDVDFIPWALDSESANVASFDIGIMPLQDDEFSRGKCSFKAIYCMAHGVPVVISPVGLNAELVRDGVNGYLASTTDQWVQRLSALIDSHELRAELGAAARRTIEQEYGSEAAGSRLVAVFRRITGE